jgi:hypothetical protein
VWEVKCSSCGTAASIQVARTGAPSRQEPGTAQHSTSRRTQESEADEKARGRAILLSKGGGMA